MSPIRKIASDFIDRIKVKPVKAGTDPRALAAMVEAAFDNWQPHELSVEHHSSDSVTVRFEFKSRKR